MQLTPSFGSLLLQFRSVFTAPSFSSSKNIPTVGYNASSYSTSLSV